MNKEASAGTSEGSTDSSSMSTFEESFAAWLCQSQRRSYEFFNMLEGYGVPQNPLESQEEPYVTIAHAAPQKNDPRHEMFLEFLIGILREKPDLARPGSNPKRVLFNLLMLCLRIRDARLLPKLCQMQQRQALSGAYAGVNLRGLLDQTVEALKKTAASA